MSLSEAFANVETASAPADSPATPAASPDAPASPIASSEAAPEPGLIGVEAEAPPQAGFKFADGVLPDQVVAFDTEGKPIKASDIQASYFRQADYTRKTQEAAAVLKQFPAAAQWFDQNKAHIEAVNPILSALQNNDPNALQAALSEFVGQRGVQLPSQRQRDEQGRFTKQTDTEDLESEMYDLEGIEPDTLAYQMAVRHNSQVARTQQILGEVGSVKQQLQQFLGTVQSEQQQMQVHSQLGQIAGSWEAKGFKADTQGAASLVGQAITPDQAMVLHNFEAIMKHNLNLNRGNQVPNTPAAMNGKPQTSLAGKSLAQAFEARTA